MSYYVDIFLRLRKNRVFGKNSLDKELARCDLTKFVSVKPLVLQCFSLGIKMGNQFANELVISLIPIVSGGMRV